jgi:hypothetical protein
MPVPTTTTGSSSGAGGPVTWTAARGRGSSVGFAVDCSPDSTADLSAGSAEVPVSVPVSVAVPVAVSGAIASRSRDRPPSASTVWPVTHRDSGDASIITVPARSSGVPSLPNGVAAAVFALTESAPGNMRPTSLSISAAEAVLTRMPSTANSAARYRVRASSAALDTPTAR